MKKNEGQVFIKEVKADMVVIWMKAIAKQSSGCILGMFQK